MNRTYTLTYIVDQASAMRALGVLQAGLKQTSTEALSCMQSFDAMDAAIKRVGTSLQTLPQGTAAATHGIGDLIKSVESLVPTWFIIEHGIDAIGQLGEKANQAREKFKQMAEDMRDTRDDFRELAALAAKDSPDNEIIATTVMSGMRAGLVPKEAREFMEQFEGSLPAAVQKGNMKDIGLLKDYYAEAGMAFGARTGLSPKTAGDFAGVIGQYGKVEGPTDLLKTMGRATYGLNEGRGNVTPLVTSLIKTAGAVVDENEGPIGSLPELAAILGVMSTHSSPDAAGTYLRKAVRSLRQFSGKQGPALEAAGIKKTDTHMEALRKIAVPMRAAAKAGTPHDVWLEENGFDTSEVTGIMEEVRDLDVIEERLGKVNSMSGEQVKGMNERYFKTTAGQSRMIRAAKKGQEVLAGQEHERWEIAKEAAEIQLRKEGAIGGLKNNVQEWIGDWGGAKPFIGVRTTRDRWKEERAMQNAKEVRADQLAHDPDWFGQPTFNGKSVGQVADQMFDAYGVGNPETDWFNEYWMSDTSRRKTFNMMATDVERAGGTPYGDSTGKLLPALKDIADETRRTNQLLQDKSYNENPGNFMPLTTVGGAAAASFATAVPGRIE